FNGTRQVAFAIMASTVVLVSVFAPVAFLQDNIGRIFAELAVTIAAAVIFSLILVLSLTPMLCSKLLHSSATENPLTHRLDAAFTWLADRYERALGHSLRMPWLSVLVSVGLAFGAWLLVQEVPREYAPEEDQGQFTA